MVGKHTKIDKMAMGHDWLFSWRSLKLLPLRIICKRAKMTGPAQQDFECVFVCVCVCVCVGGGGGGGGGRA